MNWLGVMAAVLAASSAASAQTPGAARYAIGSPAMTWVWVHPTSGSDAAAGTSNAPLRTLTEAWNRIPASTTLTGHGYGIALLPGDYPAAAVPGWMEARWGTAAAPVLIQAIGGRGTARLHGYLDVFDCHYLYFVDISIVTDAGYGGGGNALHLASCDHVLLRGCTLDGFDGTTRQPQETLKANQTQYLYVEECDISGAFWYPLDYVAVQYGHIVASKIHNAGEWCVLIKGGSACLLVEGNELYDGATGGFVAGNGTGFEFMTSPWIHYEVEDLKFVNNLIHHTGTAGMGVNGGYNVLLAYNTLYKAGTNDHIIEVVHGARSCDGNTARCTALNAAGGWGNASADGQFIPARNVYIYNNLAYNPAGSASRWSHFTIAGPVTPPAGCNVTNPAVVDANLRIVGNLIWNGGADLALGLGDTGEGGQASNPTCNPALVLASNLINQTEPQLVDPEHGDYRVRPGASLGMSFPDIPPFPGDDRATPPLAPQGNLTNTVALINLPYSSNAVSAIALGTAVNQPLWIWATGGDASWFGQSVVSHDGSAAQSGAISAGQQSWLQTTNQGPGSLLFWWRVSSAATNYLQFYIGTQLVSQISGTVGWNQYVTFLGATNQVTLKWAYTKNTSTVSGSDAGWVDQVTWLPCPYATNVPQLFFQEPGGMVASWVVSSTGAFQFARVLANTGGWALKTAGDIDGDGVSDLLFQDTARNTGGWFLNADGSTRDARFWWNVGGWEIKAAGDYENIGRAQIFFQTAGGNTAYWRLDTSGAFLAAVPLGNMGGWKLRGAGDLDGDHKAELFWQTAAGGVAIWYHNPDGSIRGAVPFNTGEWALCGVADVDLDGVCDLLWQTPDSRTGGWFMQADGTARAARFWWSTGGWKLKAAGR